MKVLERRVMSVVVLMIAALLLYFYQHEKLSGYLKEKFHIYVLIGGLAALVVAVFSFLTAGVEGDCGHDHGDEEDGCDDDHEHGGDMNPFVALIIVALPMVCSLIWTTHGVSEARQDALSEKDVSSADFSFNDLPPFTLETLEKSTTKAPDGAYMLNIFELFFTAGDTVQEKVINGLYVETEAKLRNEPNRNENGQRMRLFRLMMTCCAADAQAVPMTIEFEGETPDIGHNSWVRVAGIMSYEREGGVVYPLLKVKRIEEIPVPEGEWSEGLMK